MRWLILVVLFSSPAAFAQKTAAKLDCKYTGKDFAYDCVIRLDPPTEGVHVTVSADMPSMPMAHNIKPVKAGQTKILGQYRARLDLEMTGEWAVKLRLGGTVRDQLVLHYEFDERGARPIRRSGTAPRK
jgi:hypothetical protein